MIPVISGSGASPHSVGHLLLLHVELKTQVPRGARIRALGGKFEHIKNLVEENSTSWKDAYLEQVNMEDLFGLSAEKVSERIISAVKV